MVVSFYVWAKKTVMYTDSKFWRYFVALFLKNRFDFYMWLQRLSFYVKPVIVLKEQSDLTKKYRYMGTG